MKDLSHINGFKLAMQLYVPSRCDVVQKTCIFNYSVCSRLPVCVCAHVCVRMPN